MNRIPVFLHKAADIIERLQALGYFTDGVPRTESAIKEAIAAFQRMHGLLVDGDAGPKTQQAMFHPKHGRCGLPDMLNRSGSLCKWPVTNVPVLPRLSLRQLNRNQILAAFGAACESWNSVCGIGLRITQATSEALIVADSGVGPRDHFDGAGGTLAWSELPCGMTERNLRPLQQKYDVDEPWTQVFLQAVACHEIGHAIGIDHLQAGNLMAPFYDPRIIMPQMGDVSEAVKRYGAPKPKDNPNNGNVPAPIPEKPTTPFNPGDLVGARLVLVVEGVLQRAGYQENNFAE